MRKRHRSWLLSCAGFSVVAMSALLFASPGSSCSCTAGEGETGTARLELEPTGHKFVFAETFGFYIKNIGTKTGTVKEVKIVHPEPAFILNDIGKCKGRTLIPGASCLVEVTCGEWEKDNFLLVSAISGLGSSVPLTSLP